MAGTPLMGAQQQSLAAETETVLAVADGTHCHSSPQKVAEPCPKQRRCKEGRGVQDMAGSPLMRAQHQLLAAETETVLAVATGMCYHSSPEKVAEPCPKRRRCKEGSCPDGMPAGLMGKWYHEAAEVAAQFISRCQDRPLPLIMADAHEVAEQDLHVWQRSDGAPLGNSAKSPMVVVARLALGSGFVGD